MATARTRTTGRVLPPRVFDALLIAALTAAVLLVPLLPEADRPPLPAEAVALVMIALLWWRRSRPVAVVAAQLALITVGRLWVGTDGAGAVALLVGLYAATARRGLAVGAAAAAVDVVVVVVAGEVGRAFTAWDSQIVGTLVIDAVVVLVGAYAGVRQAWVDSLSERADRLERERELEARAAVEDERRRIARELHDVVAHHVSVMTLQAGALEQRLAVDGASQESRDGAATIRRTGRAAMTELRRMLGLLRADPDRDEGSRAPQPDLAGIVDVVERMREAGLPVGLHAPQPAPAVSAGAALAAYRIVQEALTNVLRHAGPVPTRVELTDDEDALRIAVTNDPPAESSPPAYRDVSSGGQGLAGMRERVAVFGGTLEAGPTPTGGWRVVAVLPTARLQART